MEYYFFDLSVRNSSINEDLMDNKLLKDAAFAKKFVSDKLIIYRFVAVPKADLTDEDRDLYYLNKDLLFSHAAGWLGDEESISIFEFLKKAIKDFRSLDSMRMIFSKQMDLAGPDGFGVSYTDGSFRKADGVASYGVCRMDDFDRNGIKEPFSGTTVRHSEFSGSIPDGTNNIGELNGIMTAIENFDSRSIQVIISDSIYSIKTFREWYSAWESNGWKNSSKKPVENADLIKKIMQKMQTCGKVVLLMWTKAHIGNEFNERCDKLAKDALGIGKRK